MPTGICRVCGELCHYRNPRGTRLAALRCRCGGELRSARYDPQLRRYLPKGERGRKVGRLVTCPVCGRKRREAGDNVRHFERGTRFRLLPPWPLALEEAGKPALWVDVPAGEGVCWHHRPEHDAYPTAAHYRVVRRAAGEHREEHEVPMNSAVQSSDEVRLDPAPSAPWRADVRIWREGGGAVRADIPHSVIWHSPCGYECGYGGSGPADLALNILNAFVPPSAWTADEAGDPRSTPVRCFRGTCSAFAARYHQDFKWQFIAGLSREGGQITVRDVERWIADHPQEADSPACAAHTPSEARP